MWTSLSIHDTNELKMEMQAIFSEKGKKVKAANDNTVEGDLLLGASAIAKFLGITARQTYRMIYDDIVPTFKIGGAVAARRSTLTTWMVEAEKGRAA